MSKERGALKACRDAGSKRERKTESDTGSGGAGTGRRPESESEQMQEKGKGEGGEGPPPAAPPCSYTSSASPPSISSEMGACEKMAACRACRLEGSFILP